MSTLSLLATWLVLLQGSVAAPRGEDYAVQLDRPAAVGEQYVITGSMQRVETVSLTSGGTQKRDERRSSSRFELAVKVLEVGSRRCARRAVLMVHRFSREAGGVTGELLAAGTVIDARQEGLRSLFEVGGKSVEDDARPALKAAAGLCSDDQPTNDEVVGSRQRRSIGESWPHNSDAAMRAMRSTVPVDPQSVTGRVTLVGRREVAHIPCLEYRYKFEARLHVPAAMLPAGTEDKMSAMTSEMAYSVPLDPLLPMMAGDVVFELKLRAEGTIKGVATTFEVRKAYDLHIEREPQPSAPAP